MLLARGLLSAVDLERGLAFQERFGGRLGAVMERSGVPAEWWLDQGAIVWDDPDGQINCAARDPLLPALTEAVERAFTGQAVRWLLALNQDLDRAIDLIEGALRHGETDVLG